MTILIYHGKHGDEYWLADTPEQRDAAMRQVFTKLDQWGCYDEDEGHSVALATARTGDAYFIRQFLESRKNCEYEGWDLEEVFDPCL